MAGYFDVFRLRGVYRERTLQLDVTTTYAIDIGNKISFFMKAALAGIKLWDSTLALRDRSGMASNMCGSEEYVRSPNSCRIIWID